MRLSIYYLIFVIVSLCRFSYGHAQGFTWAQGLTSIGGTYGAGIGPIGFDANDNLYSIGSFDGTVDFDKGPGTYNLTAVGHGDMFLLKEDPQGNFGWAKHFAGMSSGVYGLYGLAIDFDAAGNIYLAGYIRDSFDVDPGPGVYNFSTGGGGAGFILKLDASGNFLWARKIQGAMIIGSIAEIRGLKIINDQMYIAGNFSGTVDADPGGGVTNITSAGYSDLLIAKFDTAGNLGWVKTIGGSGDDDIWSFTVDTSMNLYLAGQFQSTVDFDPGPGIYNLVSPPSSIFDHDMFVAKLDSSGSFNWAKHIGGTGDDIARGLAVDSLGNVLVTGYYAAGTVDFDPGPGVYNITASSRDMFVLRLRNNGDFSWAMSIHPPGNDDGRAIATDGQGNVYTTGEFFLPADFDPGPGVHMLNGGVYVQKLDSSGNFVWARAWNANIPGWIGLDNANDIYVTGSFNGPADFDPGPGVFNLNGNNAGFIEKLCGSTFSLSSSATTICAGDTAHLSITAIPGATYLWTRNGTTIPSSANTLDVTQSGTYEAYANGAGCPSSSDPITITVTPLTQPTISLSGPLSEVVGQPVTINASVANAGPSYSINWSNNGVWFANTTGPSVTYTKQQGTDHITAVVSSTSVGCYDSTTSNMHIVSLLDGIIETMKAEGIEVYPNPFENVITVKGLKARDRVTLLDITGRVVQTWQATEPAQIFSIDDISAGHYVLKIMNDKGVVRVNVPVVKL